MAIEIGNFISESLKEYITTFTTSEERKTIRKRYSLAGDTLTKVLNGDRSVTINTQPILYELLKISVRNRTKKIPLLNKTHKEAISLIK
ncbi:hypothetical protein [Paenimyroides ceti]